MNKTLTSFAIATTTVISVNAATVSVTNVDFGITNAVTNEAGVAMPVLGGVIAIGSFSISDLTIQNATEVGTLVAGFTEFGTTNTFGAGFSIAGTYEFETSQNSDDAPFNAGGSVYTFIGNGATLSGSTEILIFKHDFSFAPETWTPANPAKLNGVPLATELLVGEFGNFSIDIGLASGAAPAFNLVTLVPEPSSITLLGLGSVALLLRRRR
jgi:hypothetical protein